MPLWFPSGPLARGTNLRVSLLTRAEDGGEGDGGGSLRIISPNLKVGGKGTWSWSGGTAPYAMSIRVNDDIVKKADSLSDYRWEWQVDAQEGDIVVFGVTDSKGQRIYSAPTTVEGSSSQGSKISSKEYTTTEAKSTTSSSSHISSSPKSASSKATEKSSASSTSHTSSRSSGTANQSSSSSAKTSTATPSATSSSTTSAESTSADSESDEAPTSIAPIVTSPPASSSSSLLDTLADSTQSKTPLYIGIGGLVAALLFAVALAYWWRSRTPDEEPDDENRPRRKRRRRHRSLPKGAVSHGRYEPDRRRRFAESSEWESGESEEEQLLARR